MGFFRQRTNIFARRPPCSFRRGRAEVASQYARDSDPEYGSSDDVTRSGAGHAEPFLCPSPICVAMRLSIASTSLSCRCNVEPPNRTARSCSNKVSIVPRLATRLNISFFISRVPRQRDMSGRSPWNTGTAQALPAQDNFPPNSD